MNTKYIGVFILIFLLVSCQSKHNSQKKGTADIKEKQMTKISGYVMNISADNLIHLAKIEPKLILVNVDDIPGMDTIISKNFKTTSYLHIPASVIYAHPDTLPSNKTIVILSNGGNKSRSVANFLAEKGMTIYNLQNGIKGFLSGLKKKNKIMLHRRQPDTLVETPDFGC